MEKNDGIIHATGDYSARSVGQRNILDMAEWLAKWGYTTPEILCSLIDVKSSSQKRIVKRLVDGHWAKLVPCPTAVDGYCERTRKVDKDGKLRTVVSEPMLLVPTGKARTLFSTTYGVQAARALGTGSAERIFHDLSVQRIALRVLDQSMPEWADQAEVWPGALYRAVHPSSAPPGFSNWEPPKKFFDAVAIFRGDQKKFLLGIEVELSRKDEEYGLHDAFEKIATDVRNRHIAQVMYFFPSENLSRLYATKMRDWPGLFAGFDGDDPVYKNDLVSRVSFHATPQIFRMRFH